MKKCLAAAALLISMALTLSGCFPTGEKDPNTSNVLSESEFFECEKENLSVNFKIPNKPVNVPTRIKLKEKFFNPDELLEIFFGGKTINEADSRGMHIWANDKSYLRTQSKLNEIRFDDGATCYNGLEVSRNSPINYQINLIYSREQYRDMFGIGEEIEGFPSQNAIDRALELCSTLGINNLGKPMVYAFNLEVYEKYKELTSPWLNSDIPFTKDNEVYILRFRQTFGEIELADLYDYYINDSTAKYGKVSLDSPEVVVGVSKTDIFHFMVEEAYEAEYETISNEPIKFGLNYALNEFSGYLERSYFNNETKFIAADIVYFPVESKEDGYIEYSLAWCFYGTVHDKKSKYSDNYNIVFRTENGARIDYKY